MENQTLLKNKKLNIQKQIKKISEENKKKEKRFLLNGVSNNEQPKSKNKYHIKPNNEVLSLFRKWNLFSNKVNITKVNMNLQNSKKFFNEVKIARSFLDGTLGSNFIGQIMYSKLSYFPEEINKPKTTKDFDIILNRVFEILKNEKYTKHSSIIRSFLNKISFSDFFIGNLYSGLISIYILYGMVEPKTELKNKEGIQIFIEYWNERLDPEYIFSLNQKEQIDNFLSENLDTYFSLKQRFPITTKKFKDHYEFLFYLVFGILKKIKSEGKLIISPRALNGPWFKAELEKYRIETGHVR